MRSWVSSSPVISENHRCGSTIGRCIINNIFHLKYNNLRVGKLCIIFNELDDRSRSPRTRAKNTDEETPECPVQSSSQLNPSDSIRYQIPSKDIAGYRFTNSAE